MKTSDKNEIDRSGDEAFNERRKFLKTAGKLAVTAPAVTLLISASLKPTEAQAVMYHYDPGPIIW